MALPTASIQIFSSEKRNVQLKGEGTTCLLGNCPAVYLCSRVSLCEAGTASPLGWLSTRLLGLMRKQRDNDDKKTKDMKGGCGGHKH